MSFESQITNYYERLVVEELNAREVLRELDEGMLADIACVALNRLPVRYYRHPVDMAFYLGVAEQRDMAVMVSESVDYAIELVQQHKTRD